MRFTVALFAFALLAATCATPAAGAGTEVARRALGLLGPSSAERAAAREWLTERGNEDAIPALIQALRFSRAEREGLVEALTALAGETAGDEWFDWMLWQQAHPEIAPFEGFAGFKAAIYRRIDPAFDLFLHDGVAHEIRLEEIAWGGVRKDGIPALTNPGLIAAEKAAYLTGDELVFGVAINGDERAYPLRIMDWHEMFNDVVGGIPVSLAYCTLCGSGILFDTRVEGRDRPFVFGSSGFLYRSNKLMYDQETHSLWNQFTGRPVVGPLTGSGIELKTLPVVITSWGAWREAHPGTGVLSLDTGFARDYTPGAPYARYFDSPDLMFPALVDESELKAKDYVFALRGALHQKAWPLSLFEASPLVNDMAGIVPVTLLGDAETRTVRAYRTGGEAFEAADDRGTLSLDGETWTVTEDALIGPAGQSLPRLPGHIAYWFAWDGYLGEDGELATGLQQ